MVEVIQQVALDKEEVEREERTASVSAGLLVVVVVGKNQVAGLVPMVAAVLVDPYPVEDMQLLEKMSPEFFGTPHPCSCSLSQERSREDSNSSR